MRVYNTAGHEGILLASGVTDGYICVNDRESKEYDERAPMLIVAEAGAKLIDIEGNVGRGVYKKYMMVTPSLEQLIRKEIGK